MREKRYQPGWAGMTENRDGENRDKKNDRNETEKRKKNRSRERMNIKKERKKRRLAEGDGVMTRLQVMLAWVGYLGY